MRIRDLPGWMPAIMVLALGSCAVEPAFAQDVPQCPSYDIVLKNLKQSFQEEPVGRGPVDVEDGSAVVEVFASPEGATWTIVVVRPDGSACPVTAGFGWQRLPMPLPGTPS